MLVMVFGFPEEQNSIGSGASMVLVCALETLMRIPALLTLHAPEVTTLL